MQQVLAQIRTEIEAGYRHAFVLTQNVHDAVYYEDGRRLSFAGALCTELSRGGQAGVPRCVARYSLSQGIVLYANGVRVRADGDVLRTFDQRTGLGDIVVRDVCTPADIHARLRDPAHVLPSLYPWLRMDQQQNSLVIDGAEYVTAADRQHLASLEDRVVLETLERWARDTALRRTQGCLVLLCPRLGDIPVDLVQGDGVFTVLPVEYPSLEQRQQFLIAHNMPPDQATRTANLTTGFRRIDLDEVVRRGMTEDDIVEHKARMITARCGDTLELVESPYGLEHANAQPHVRRYLESLRDELIRDRKSIVIPMGLLFVGVPGNGKSHLARAFAHDCGMNMLRLKNVRSMWVGESERNLETVLDLLPSLAPSVVFMDEVDQLLGSRGASAGAHDGGGQVDQRLLGRLLEFMGNPDHRGEILWIGATNRPDLLDIAAIRRFDRIFPFMNPTGPARAALVTDLLGRLQIPVDAGFAAAEAADLMGDFSCDEVEKVMRRSYEIARNQGRNAITLDDVRRTANLFQHNYDPLMHELVALLSVQATNFRCDLPWFDENGRLVNAAELPPALRPLVNNQDDIDRRSLQNRVNELRAQIRLR